MPDQTVVLSATGLTTSPNQLNVKDGSLSEAKNIIVRRDNVVEQIRGFSIYGDDLPLLTDRAKQLSTYRERILRHYGTKLQYDSDGQGAFVDFAGNFTEAELGIRLKSVEANGNYYFATSEGIKRLSSATTAGLAQATIVDAGVPKALDLKANIVYDFANQTGFLPQDSAVAYRIVIGTRDANNNLLLGSPSERVVIANSLQNLEIQDYMRVLYALDSITDNTTSARISDGNYVATLGLGANAAASQLRNNLIALATKLDNDIVYGDDGTLAPIDLVGGSGTVQVSGNVATVTRQGGAAFTDYFLVGSEIEITGLLAANAVLNGTWTISSVAANTIQFNVVTANFGPNATDATVFLKSNEYRSISQPAVPSEPATNAELVALQDYLSAIILRLQSEPPTTSLAGTVITPANRTAYIDTLDITTSANVQLIFTLPENLTTDYFYQVYRSPITSAEGVSSVQDLSPSDELQLAYEAYLTADDIANGFISIIDETPEEFLGANLYTNAASGEGILQANDTPPFAKDINRFRNVVFYANTKTKYRLQLSLLGVEKLITAFNNGDNPRLATIVAGSSQVYTFVTGEVEINTVTAVADVADSLNGTYFDVYNANDEIAYRYYFKTSGAADTPPVSTGFVLTKIDIPTGSTASFVAQRVIDTLNLYINDFSAEATVLPAFTVSNIFEGSSTGVASGTSGFGVVNVQQGVGENAALKQVLISQVVSPARAVEATARSLIRVMNQNANESIYATYLSSSADVPGKILFESRNLTDGKFYVVASDSNVGSTWNPDISPEFTITNIDTVTDIITTSAPHAYNSGDQVVISMTDTTPAINGVFAVERVSSTEFKIGINITTVNTPGGNVSSVLYATSGDNEEKANRIYFSKYQQPEAVPIVNYFDVGAEDKAILRIYPLRDSLFVYKEDGVYRVSGEVSPFQIQLFDSSTVLIADDSLGVVDNQIYGWTLKGIVSISESTPQIISRDIDNIILKIGSNSYPNFRTATWGVGYESDNSYTVYSLQQSNEVRASIAYRYNTLTGSWTTIIKQATCGVINSNDDKFYIGAGDVNSIEKERKNFNRTDYANREYPLTLSTSKYVPNFRTMQLPDISNIEIGDVITQDQTLTVYQFNNLLRRIDRDPSFQLGTLGGDPTGYYNALVAVAGNNLRSKIEGLANRLDMDGGVTQSNFAASIAGQSLTITNNTVAAATVITTSAPHNLVTGRVVTISGSNSTPSINGTFTVTVLSPTTFSIPKQVFGAGTTGGAITQTQNFEDVKTNYNTMMAKLNVDLTVIFSNFELITTNSLQEVIVTKINTVTKTITVNKNLDFVAGDLILYKAIESTFTYCPNTMGDPVNWKHMREAQILFENRAITSATIEFSTDLLPEFEKVNFDLDGNGIFGHNNFGAGFFGGASSSAPFRTYIPRNCQRCTFIRVKFTHRIAREHYSIFGISMTGRKGISSRAYR